MHLTFGSSQNTRRFVNMRKDGWDSFTKRELILNSRNLVGGYRNTSELKQSHKETRQETNRVFDTLSTGVC